VPKQTLPWPGEHPALLRWDHFAQHPLLTRQSIETREVASVYWLIRFRLSAGADVCIIDGACQAYKSTLISLILQTIGGYRG
jgi:hypothetical protein